MKEFWIYTGLRIVLFLGSLGIVVGVWFLIAGQVPVLLGRRHRVPDERGGLLLPAQPPREAFAQRVETRAERMTSKIDEMRAKEDADDDAPSGAPSGLDRASGPCRRLEA